MKIESAGAQAGATFLGAEKARRFVTRAALGADLRALGLNPGDTVMVHASVSRIGRLLGGPDALIGAIAEVIGPAGTLLAYADWDAGYEALVDGEGRVPDAWRMHVPPFDAETSRAARENGVLPEFLRSTPGTLRSGNPGASIVARGAGAAWYTADHPLDYGYGAGSPFAKLVQAEGRVLMLGAPLETMTLLHHAEHLARLPGKRVKRCEVPLVETDGVAWRIIEEFDTSEPVVAGMPEDAFATIVEAFLAAGRGKRGRIGGAESVLVEAAAITAFAVKWMERRFG